MKHIPDLGPDGPAALARLVRETEFRGRVVARQVCGPLEELLEAGQITGAQYEAGRRLRDALIGSWPQPRVTMRWGYTSDASALDDEGEPLSEDEAWQRQTARHALWTGAQAAMDRECWPVVRAVCEGYRLGSQGRPDLLRRGLGVLVALWKVR